VGEVIEEENEGSGGSGDGGGSADHLKLG
jgi:hypothetical protein